MFNILDIAFVSLQKCLPKQGCRFNAQPSPEYLNKVRELYTVLIERGSDAADTYLKTSISSLPGIEQRAITEFVLDSLKHIVREQDTILARYAVSLKHVPDVAIDTYTGGLAPSLQHVLGVVVDTYTGRLVPSLEHVPGAVVDTYTSRLIPSLEHILDPTVDTYTGNLTSLLRHAPDTTVDTYTGNLTSLLRHAPDTTVDTYTGNLTPFLRHVPDTTVDTYTGNLTPFLRHVPDTTVDTYTSARDGNLNHLRSIIDIINNTRSVNIDYKKIEESILSVQLSANIDYKKIEESILSIQLSANIDYKKIEESITSSTVTGRLEHLDTNVSSIFKYQKASIKHSPIPVNLLINNLNVSTSHIKIPSNTLTRKSTLNVKYKRGNISKINTYSKVGIDTLKNDKVDIVERSKSLNIQTKEWNYLFDSAQYDWSLDRIETHSDNIDIKEYCYPSYTVYLAFNNNADIFSDLLQTDSTGKWYFNYSRRAEIIEGIKRDMSMITYQSQPDITISMEYESLLCVAITSVYRTSDQRDEALEWFNRIYSDSNSIFIKKTQYIKHALTQKVSTSQCGDPDVYDPPGILYQPIPRDPNAPFQPPNLTIYTDPPSPITIDHHDQEITIISSRSNIPITVMTPLGKVGAIELLQDVNGLTIGSDVMQPGSVLNYTIDSNDQVDIVYIGKSVLEQHKFKVLFYGIKFEKCHIGTKFRKCHIGTKFRKCHIGTKFRKCT